jgi:citrate lyase subunit beta/citryl-CoA lyase
MLDKARGLPADQVFLDLEDAVAPLAKPDARKNVVAALNDGGWGGKTRVVRVNDLTTAWTYRDVVEVVEGAGANLDCVMLPKVQGPEQIAWLDLTLTQIEKTLGLPVGRIGIEAQIENARGLVNVDAIAAASPRIETIIFGPADFMASINMKSLVVGALIPDYPGDPYHYILMRILMGRSCRSATWTPSARWPSAPRRWASTGSGCCTPARSTRPTRSSPRRRRTTTTPNSSSTRTSTPPRRPAASSAP